jgi:hypothetical protein
MSHISATLPLFVLLSTAQQVMTLPPTPSLVETVTWLQVRQRQPGSSDLDAPTPVVSVAESIRSDSQAIDEEDRPAESLRGRSTRTNDGQRLDPRRRAEPLPDSEYQLI